MQSDLRGHTHLWLQRVGRRVHRRRRRQHRLGRAERRVAPVLERFRAGDRPVVLRAAALRTDVLLLADRRQGAGRHSADRRLRPGLARHAQGGVLAHPGVRRLELPPRTRRPGRGGQKAQSRNRGQAGGGRRDAGRTDRAGRSGRRVPDRARAHRRRWRSSVLPHTPVVDFAAAGGEPHLPRGTVLLRYEAKRD